MAKIKMMVRLNNRLKDGTYNIVYRLVHNSSNTFISTNFFVKEADLEKVKGRLTSNINSKSQFYNKALVDEIFFREQINALGSMVDRYSLVQLKDILIDAKNTKITGEIPDFFKFAKTYIGKKKTTGTKLLYGSAINSFREFARTEHLPFNMITLSYIEDYDEFLVKQGMSSNTIFSYLNCIKAIILDARKKYNREETGTILVFNPFTNFEFRNAETDIKRDISLEQLKALYNLNITDHFPSKKFWEKNTIADLEQARDFFFISFFLCGANAKDIYEATQQTGRIMYVRSKTKNSKTYKPEISIKIEPELLPLIEKYKGKNRMFDYSERYGSHLYMIRNLNIHLKMLGRVIGMEDELTTYYARHGWSKVAIKHAGLTMKDVAICLTHESDYKQTEVYTGKDYNRIDTANRKVIDCLIEKGAD